MVDLPHKIYTPQRPPELVLRPRLIETLQKITQRKLIALVAPAGYGKTSLLIDLAHMMPLPLCWYTLDAYDSDPWGFLLYLTAAVEHRFPGSVMHTLQLLQGDGHQFSVVVESLIHELNTIQSDFVLCLDDWHLVDKVPAISDLIATILSRCPNSHILLASRSHPSLPNQMLLAARRQFLSINETQLRFSAEELAAVIAVEGITNFTPADTEWLVTQSDGWLTGILLALQTTNGDVGAIVATRTVMSRPAHHFLAEQVLDQQPPEIQQFLIESSMLEELTVERCNMLLERTDSWKMLEYVLAHRLFITEIAPGVLRQHPLFRELLQHRLRFAHPARFRALSLRVAADLARQGQWSSAFDLCMSVADLPCARRILNDAGEHLYMRGHLEALERAFASLPADTLDVSLLCLKAHVALDRRQIDQAQHLAEQAALCSLGTPHPWVTLLEAAIDQVCERFESARDRCLQILETTNDPQLRGAARLLQRFGHVAMVEAQRKLDCAVAFRRGLRRIGAVSQEELDHGQAAAHRCVSQRRVAVLVAQVRIEVHRQHFTRVHEIVFLDCIKERADAFGALFLRLGFEAGRHEPDDLVHDADPDQRDQREDDRDLGDVQALGDLVGHVGAGDEQHHRHEQEESQVQEQAEDHRDAEDGEQRLRVDAERALDVLPGQVGEHR
ncbi:MAG TPA: hypothetical protein VFZ66_08140, partial [Herpetosiphonaceae bacterium]